MATASIFTATRQALYNNRLQRTALRAAAEPERYADNTLLLGRSGNHRFSARQRRHGGTPRSAAKMRRARAGGVLKPLARARRRLSNTEVTI